MVQRRGLGFDVKIIDFFQWKAARPEQREDDVRGLVEILYNATGGARHYSKQPEVIRYIVCGLKKSLLRTRFRSAVELRDHLEELTWS
jgi:hypothetical protein